MEYTIQELSLEHVKYIDSIIETFKNLSEIGDINEQRLTTIIKNIQTQGTKLYFAIHEEFGVIGSIGLLLEQKLQKQGALAGHIEDVVVRKGFEGNGIAGKLLEKSIQTAKENNCYKIILDCDTKLIPLYEKFGFENDGTFMRMYL